MRNHYAIENTVFTILVTIDLFIAITYIYIYFHTGETGRNASKEFRGDSSGACAFTATLAIIDTEPH